VTISCQPDGRPPQPVRPWKSRTRSLSNATFSFFDHFMKIGWFYTEIWRYIDFQNGGRPPSWNCFTTIRDHPQSPCQCQISCQSDTQIWRYSCLNFFPCLAWNVYSGPQNWGFGGLWTPNCDYSSSKGPKGTSFRKSASSKLSTVKNLLKGLTCSRVDRKCVGHSQTHTHTHTHRQTDTHTQVNLYCVHAQHWTDK